jgi:PIN domain nuclease of toxin-antitoxin system
VKLLLDTHAFLWMLQAPEKLPAKVVQAHNDPANALFVSVASLWEIQIKTAIGKLELDVPLAQIVREQLQGDRFSLLDIRAEHVLELGALPQHHGDPFDRMMIAQARAEKLPLVSIDRVFTQYPVEIFW